MRKFLTISLVLATAVFLLGGLAGCQTAAISTPEALVENEMLPTAPYAATSAATLPPLAGSPTVQATETVVPATATVRPTLTPPSIENEAVFTYDSTIADCGHILPLVSAYDDQLVEEIAVDPADLENVLATLPPEASAALDHLLAAPETVSLAAYQVGNEAEGVYLNANAPMPLASVVKLIHLVAYAEAAAAGEIDPLSVVTVEELERFYLPTLDLRAHSEALDVLEAEGKIFGQPPAMLLDEVPRMMIEFSANSATDYLHWRLGQERIEETAMQLGLTSQTAPCPFLGQFLAMGNHTRPQVEGADALKAYLTDPQRYGQEVMQFTAAFSEEADFREQAIRWRQETRLPRASTQRQFSEALNAQGSAGEYAALLARLAQNGLGSGESSYTARRFLEWPMRYAVNQGLFSNLGYKGGSLPGILTTAYYAYPQGDAAPVVVALFYRDIPGQNYGRWRRSQTHDELARWLLYEPQAIPALRSLLTPAEAE